MERRARPDCAGVLFRIGARTRKARASRSIPSARPCAPCRHSETPMPGGAASFRCGFFEWKAMKGQKAKQPYAITMKDGSPFGLGGVWENWRDPASGEWLRTFAVITTDANELVAEIQDRMPLITAPSDYARWLSDDPDPRELLRPFRPLQCGCGRSRRGSFAPTGESNAIAYANDMHRAPVGLRKCRRARQKAPSRGAPQRRTQT